jgi:enoyl-CoA hydratase/carnithine racemase
MTGEAIGAEQALSWGLVERAVKPRNLDKEVNRTLDMILECGAEAIRAQKRLCKLWEEAPLEQCVRASIDELAASYESDEPRQRIAAFQRSRTKR